MTQNTSYAVMAQRQKGTRASLDFFPTPLWATRALCEFLQRNHCKFDSCWEPACGEGHMVRPLREYFATVHASDVQRYAGIAHNLDDFLLPVPRLQGCVTWIVTNPPFLLAEQFALRAMSLASDGVALLVRSAFLEGIGRHTNLFKPYPPSWVLQFTERVPMIEGRLSKTAVSATAYCWLVWSLPTHSYTTRLHWIPPCRKQLERDGDYA